MHIESIRAAAWSAVTSAWTLAAAHPAITSYIVLTLFVGLFKPRTKAEYAVIATRYPTWFWSRWSAFLVLVAPIVGDPAKLAKVVTDKLLKGAPRGPMVLAPLALALALTLMGCSPAFWKAASLLADKTKCAVAYQHLPNAQIAEKCLRDTAPEDIARILEIVGQARQETAAAVARQAEKDQVSGVCR